MLRALPFAILLAAWPALAGTLIVPGTAGSNQVSSGINSENLQDSPVTDTIPHKAGDIVYFDVTITAGTSTNFTVTCEESPNGSNWFWIPECTNANPRVCTQATLSFTFGSILGWVIDVASVQPYIRCTFDDAANGSGTLVVRGFLP
jgi:hypothetical protein